MTIHIFTPPETCEEAVLIAAGEVEVIELVEEAVQTQEGAFPLYRVRNLLTNREALAFGDELRAMRESP